MNFISKLLLVAGLLSANIASAGDFGVGYDRNVVC